jgi:phage gp16-like protein
MSALLKTIHVACRQLGLDAETRRDLQLVATGKASLKDMTASEQQLVLDALKAKGFQPNSAGTGKKGWRNPASRRDVRMCHVLWGKLVRAGAVQLPGATGLNAFIRARFEAAWGAVPIDIDSMRDWKQIAAVIEALKAMCRRSGIEA